jgi:hypothetical protein
MPIEQSPLHPDLGILFASPSNCHEYKRCIGIEIEIGEIEKWREDENL